MNTTTKRWLKSGLAMLLALCLVIGAPITASATVDAMNCTTMEVQATVEDAVLYVTNAQKIIDAIVTNMTSGEYAGMFNGSATNSTVKTLAIRVITQKLDENEDLMTEIGFEPTAANKSILAEEIYLCACIYYDEINVNGGTEAHANELAILEIVRFALVNVRDFSEALAPQGAEFFYATYLDYVESEAAAVDSVARYLHNFENGVCTVCGDIVSYRLYGANRYETAFKVADELKATLGVEKFSAVVVACGTDAADALSGSYLAAKKGAPILLTNRFNVENVQTYIKNNMAADGTVYILGGEAAVSATFEAGLTGLTVKRLAGANRFETSLEVLKEAGVAAGQEILVCTGLDYADSLSASATGMPILLVRGTYKLFDSQKAYLAELGGAKFTIVGGTNAVNAAVESDLTAYGTVEARLAGSNRYQTSTMLAEKCFPNATKAVLAYGRSFPDGLCGGPLANAMGAPLVLTQTNQEGVAASFASAKGIKTGYVLGGTIVLADTTVYKILGENTAILLK